MHQTNDNLLNNIDDDIKQNTNENNCLEDAEVHRFQRTEKLIGSDALNTLRQSKVAVFGVGGVGSYVVEALTRCGIGQFIIVDKDVVDVTNINRQLIALDSTIGMPKVEVCKKRMLDINPKVIVDAYQTFYLPETKDAINLSGWDYIVDAIDNVTAKLSLIEHANTLNIPIISSLGTGNKLDPSKFSITEIEKTSMCPLAKVMRKELKARGIKKVKVLYSTEKPIVNQRPPSSISFVPSVAGLMIAGEVVKNITETSHIDS